MASKIKRFLSMALAVFMIMTMMPATVLATEAEQPIVVTETEPKVPADDVTTPDAEIKEEDLEKELIEDDENSGDQHLCESYTEETLAAVDATCTETGLTEGKKCSACGEVLVVQEEVAALGHTEETIAAVAATCTAAGLTEGKKCTVCGEVLAAQEEVAALGHTEETLAAVDATCTATGLTEGKKCSACNEIIVAQEEIPALGHSFTDGVCTACGEVEVIEEPEEVTYAACIGEAGYDTLTEALTAAALQDAADGARLRAEVLAYAAGTQLHELTEIRHGSGMDPVCPTVYGVSLLRSVDAAAVDIAPQDITAEETVTFVWSLLE